MLYDHATETCFQAAIGAGGLGQPEFEAALRRTAPALDELRALRQTGGLPLLALPAARDDLPRLEALAGRYREAFEQIVVLGTGGSSLGGRALAALAGEDHAPRLRFMDNIDPRSFADLFAGLTAERAGFLVISKSGATAETLTQYLLCRRWMADRLAGRRLAEHFTVIAEPGDNPLRRLARADGIETLDHDPGLGGRYSALSLVGLLPALVAGLDAAAIRGGAAAALDRAWASDPADSPPAVGAAIAAALAEHRGVATTVLMPYADRLEPFARWFRQLWAESLGKAGQGTTPVAALGAVDQHSQLQLYLDGPRDKMFTLVILDRAGEGERMEGAAARDPALGYLEGRTMGDLMAAEQRATAETLTRNGRPLRLFRLARLDEQAMGAMMMHFMLETIIAGRLLGVDPFDQPAVEEGKRLARTYLEDMHEP